MSLRIAPADPIDRRTLERVTGRPGQWWALIPEPGPTLRWVYLAGHGWQGASGGRLVALGNGGEMLEVDPDKERGLPHRLPEACAGIYLWLPPDYDPPASLAFWRVGSGWALSRLSLPHLGRALRRPGHSLARANRARQIMAKEGWRSAKDRLLHGLLQREIYAEWVSRHDTLDRHDLAMIARRVQAMNEPPLISVVMPVYNPPLDCLQQALDSLCNQLYPHWELCAANDASDDPQVAALLDRAAQNDPRVRVIHRQERGHISAASNSALTAAQGSYVALMDHDDILPPHALYLVAEEILAHPEADIIYSDEDKIDEQGRRFGPYFKPDWDPELFLGQNMISHLGVYRRSLLERIGGFRLGLEGSQDYDLCLRALEHSRDDRVRHIPRVLYHWRAIAASTASGGQAKTYAFHRARQAISEALNRRGIAARVEFGPNWGHYVVNYLTPSPRPSISLLSPLTDDRPDQAPPLSGLLQALPTLLDMWDIELVVAGPAHRLALARAEAKAHPNLPLRLLEAEGGWAALANAAAAKAKGTILGLVDPGLRPTNQAWLEEAACLLDLPENGALGGLLLRQDGAVLEAGLTLLPERVAAPVNYGEPLKRIGNFMRHSTRQRLSAVSGACLFTQRQTFQRLGGLDQDGLDEAFADVDYCLRLRKEGLAVVWTPHARLELARPTGGGPLAALLASLPALKETKFMERRWANLLAADPYHNPNLAYGSLQQNPVASRAPKPWGNDA
ncbi:MAG: glycosyltransferase [Deltaproteobacteria bacterium]|nr:glycosyltransferase [Deltaproteobacteria bacterium]